MKNEKITEELKQISELHEGFVNPHDVVDFARDPATALYNCFTWDETEAAEQWRLHEARNLLRVYVQVLPNVDDPVRVAISLPADRRRDRGYRLTTTVMNDSERRQELLQMAMAELDCFKQKYKYLTELVEVFRAIDAVPVVKRKKAM